MFDLAVTMNRDGGRCKIGTLDARIICTDLNSTEPLILAVACDDGTEFLSTREIDGNSSYRCAPLTTLPETKVRYANVDSDGESGCSYACIEDCEKEPNIAGALIGIIKITVTGDDWDVEKVAL